MDLMPEDNSSKGSFIHILSHGCWSMPSAGNSAGAHVAFPVGCLGFFTMWLLHLNSKKTKWSRKGLNCCSGLTLNVRWHYFCWSHEPTVKRISSLQREEYQSFIIKRTCGRSSSVLAILGGYNLQSSIYNVVLGQPCIGSQERFCEFLPNSAFSGITLTTENQSTEIM